MENKTNAWASANESLEKADKELLKFYFDQAEKSLKSTIELSDKITTRAYALLAFFSPLIYLLFSLLVRRYFGGEVVSTQLSTACWLALIPVAVSICLLLKVAFPKNYYQLGSEPINIVSKEYYENDEYVGENSFKLALSFEIEEYQTRITYMDELNYKRVKELKFIFTVILVSSTLFVISLLCQLG